MQLDNIYELDVLQKCVRKEGKDFTNASYVSDIYLEFSGTAHIKVILLGVCIEDTLAKEEYHVKNFRLCPFPICVYDDFKIECDIDFTMSFVEHEHDPFIRSAIVYKGAFYELVDGSRYKYLYMKDAKFHFTNELDTSTNRNNDEQEDKITVQSYDLPMILESSNFRWLKKHLVSSLGEPYAALARSELHINNVPLPTIIIQRSELARLVDNIFQEFPYVHLELMKIPVNSIIDQNRRIILKMIKKLREKIDPPNDGEETSRSRDDEYYSDDHKEETRRCFERRKCER